MSRKRLQERLKDPTKHWKISENDFLDHKYWNKYMKAYEQALVLWSTKWEPIHKL